VARRRRESHQTYYCIIAVNKKEPGFTERYYEALDAYRGCLDSACHSDRTAIDDIVIVQRTALPLLCIDKDAFIGQLKRDHVYICRNLDGLVIQPDTLYLTHIREGEGEMEETLITSHDLNISFT
jgi:hypothetical protein